MYTWSEGSSVSVNVIDDLKASVMARFQSVLSDELYRMASFLDPRFKATYCQYRDMQFFVKNEMRQLALHSLQREQHGLDVEHSYAAPATTPAPADDTVASSSTASVADASSQREEPDNGATRSTWMSFWHMNELEQSAAKRSRISDSDIHQDIETKIVNKLTAYCTEEFMLPPVCSSSVWSSTPHGNGNADVVAFWQTAKDRFPLLSDAARKYLGVPATSVPSERVFSATGYITNDRRALLKLSFIDKLMFLRAKWQL